MKPCKLWHGPKNNRGYGSASGKLAHRMAWILKNGPVPPGMELDHTCNTPTCYEEEHLEPVTSAENKRRAHVRQYGNACRQGHPRTPENVYTSKTGKSYCRPCRQRYWKAYYEAGKPNSA